MQHYTNVWNLAAARRDLLSKCICTGSACRKSVIDVVNNVDEHSELEDRCDVCAEKFGRDSTACAHHILPSQLFGCK